MKTVFIDYATIAPDTLENMVRFYFPTASCYYHDFGDEDYYEFTVVGVIDLAGLEDLLAEYI